jgi:perosamine synthetase
VRPQRPVGDEREHDGDRPENGEDGDTGDTKPAGGGDAVGTWTTRRRVDPMLRHGGSTVQPSYSESVSATDRPREIVPGAPPRHGDIALASPDIGDLERELVDESLRSGWIAYGPFVDRFEDELRRRLDVRHAVAVSSGTAALHVALVVAGVQPDDEVPVSTLTFISPANAIRYAGAWPVLIDAEPRYGQLDVEKLAAFLAEECERRDGGLYNRATGRRIGALLPVHVLGHPADVDRVAELAAEYGVPVVEDAAEGLGAELRGRPVGGLGVTGCLSFNGNKIITCGGGGMVVTDDDDVAERVRYLVTQAKDDPLEYVHGAVGFNYRLSNPHAALGCAQLARLDDFVAAKRRIAARYAEGLADVPGIEVPGEAEWAFSTFWLYTVHVHQETFGMGSRDLMRRLLDNNVQVRPLWQPLHRSPAHVGSQAYRCDVADRLHATGLSLPCSVALSADDQARVIELIRRAAGAAAS